MTYVNQSEATLENYSGTVPTFLDTKECNYVEVTCYSLLNNSKSAYSIASVPLSSLPRSLLLVICVWSLRAAYAGDCYYQRL